MARGQADYAAQAIKEASASVSDMGEVAARLGSIVTYDKRGSVVYIDDFEEPVLKWETIAASAADYARLDSTSCKSGSQAVKLHTSDAVNAYSGIGRFMATSSSKRLGMEISFSNLTTDCMLDILLWWYDSTFIGQAAMRIDEHTHKLYLKDANDEWVEVASYIGLWANDFQFYTCKLVYDFDTKKYVRVLFFNTEYDVSSIGIYSPAVGQAPFIRSLFYLYPKSTIGGDCWLDGYILTQEEP